MTISRRIAIPLFALGLLMVAITGCGGSKSTSRTIRITTNPPAQAPPADGGGSVRVATDGGYVFRLGPASRPSAIVSTSGADGANARSAPPGRTYVAIDVPITNPTDRSEPLPFDATGGPTLFQFAVPGAKAAAFGGNCMEIIPVPSGMCELYAILETTTPSSYQSAMSPMLAPRSTIIVHLVTGNSGVPEGAPIAEVRLFYGQQKPPVLVPAAASG